MSNPTLRIKHQGRKAVHGTRPSRAANVGSAQVPYEPTEQRTIEETPEEPSQKGPFHRAKRV